MKWKLSLLLIFFLTSSTVFGQDTDLPADTLITEDLQVLQTLRGDVFFGRILSEAEDSVLFEVRDLGPLRFGRSEIQWLGPVKNAGWLQDQIRNSPRYRALYDLSDYYWQENLSYSMTAFPYPRGGGEYRNISILYNIVDAGLSDHLSIGGGIVIPFLFIVRSKLSYQLSEKFYMGVGLNNLIGFTHETDSFISHLFGILTFGSTQQYINITAGTARDWAFPEDSPFIVTIGGSTAFAKNWKIYADVGVSPGNEGIIPNFMLSWFKNKNRLEIGVLGVADGFFSAIPMIGYARRF
ncbi:hypothetical protein [Flavilitoribacter nigricans]|uniref:Phosphoribosylformylglycinamidine synthase n=1 Tax=Flavilitoribacter nigricans (strain ATCC 23147 / DSM 23189 / NBRC 102662 / NCIMB 1420 / SS-2) TaxID=1122177 RepID=A0A2D0NDI4_FLAN2|nr:hypothetical protein [Flavilitoribacter nigricans]PHN05833.1 hypothetical protein CRP01_15290 [Flavilitoribacter nigricans DSM 23189 = NBRC 102662]